jgi:hypothetical protein
MGILETINASYRKRREDAARAQQHASLFDEMERHIEEMDLPAAPAATGNITSYGRYEALQSVLGDALEQAASGKGHARHDNGRAFQEQAICWINRELGTVDGARFQAVKKTLESAKLEPVAAEKELLGAINYLAAAVIGLREKVIK